MSTPNTDISKVLWNDSVSLNGYNSTEQYREHILEQYKIYLEMADRISNRRDVANAFFLTLNGLVLSATDRTVYWPLTHLESKIPGLFATGYLIAAIALWLT